jgi:MFS family permease
VGLPTVLTMLAAASLTVMANATISPGLPGLRDHFAHVPGIDTLTGLIMTLPSAGVVTTAALFGWLSDRVGRRPILLAGILCYALAGASGFVAGDLTALLVGRFLLGCSVGAVMTMTGALAADYFAGPARERFVGRQGMAMSLGGVVFLTLGGVLATLDWRAPFLVYLTALLVFPCAFVLLRDVPRAPPPVAGGPVAPPMPWGTVALVSAVAAFSMLVFYMIPVKVPFLLRELGSSAPMVAGVTVAGATITGAMSASQYGRLKARLSSPAIAAGAFTIMAAGYAVVALAPLPAVLAAGVVLAGFGLGVMMPNQNIWLMAEVPAARRGAAAGMLTTAVFVGQFLSPLASSPVAAVVGLAGSYGVAAGALLLAATALLLLARQRGTGARTP